jgi:hypothetical protein
VRGCEVTRTTRLLRGAPAVWAGCLPYGCFMWAPARTVRAGIDLSPAVRDYLRLSGRDLVDRRWARAEQLPAGPWKQVITGSAAGTSAMGG